jgi:predicted HTH transcriptional regulator
MSDIDFQKLISGGTESRELEFKPGFNWLELSSRKLKEETIKAIISMANTKGGSVVLGIKEDKKKRKLTVEGIKRKFVNIFEKHEEDILAEVHRYCSQPPNINFCWTDAETLSSEKKLFIIIRIAEFEEFPILTTKPSKEKENNDKRFVIEADTLYVRSKSAPWSSRKAKQGEFEEVIRLAADKHRNNLKNRGYTKIDSLSDKFKEERADYD